MFEVKLDEPVSDIVNEPKKLFVIVNERGLYLKNNKPYWTNDLNKCSSVLCSENTAVDRARNLLKNHEEYVKYPSKCCNEDLFLSFEKLFIKQVKIVECE